MKPLNSKQEEALRNALSEEHKLNPLRQAALKSQLMERVSNTATDFRAVRGFRVFKTMPVFLSLFVAFILAGGAAFATESSVPGDIFHPLKLAAEQVELKFAASAETKATVEARQAVERLEEVSRLRERAELEVEAETKAKLEDRRLSSEVEAKASAEHAISTLENVKTSLKNKGKARSIENLDRAIKRLRDHATESKVIIEVKREDPSKTPDDKDDQKEDEVDREDSNDPTEQETEDSKTQVTGTIKIDVTTPPARVPFRR